ncbi:MAG: phage baseplate assembly protein [Deltaproteobacteria bacterium]|nr:phage baseplate assembly protein [Deltaproteobacteria bacterium]
MRRLYTAIRVLVKAVRTGKIQLIDVKGRGEDFTSKELFQDYGFASRPLDGAEGIMLFIGGVDNAVVIATEDRRYRLTLEKGEVGLYTDEGDCVHLKRNKEISIKSGGQVNIEAAVSVSINAPAASVTAPSVTVTAATSATIVSPTVNLGAAAGLKAIPTEDFMTLYNTHTHSGGSAPDQQAGATHKTTKVKAV